MIKLLMSGCAIFALCAPPVFANTEGPSRLEDLLGSALSRSSPIPSARFSALREAAMAYGACNGLNRRQHELAKDIEIEAKNLDAVYNFAALAVRADTPGYPTCPGGDCKMTSTEGYIIPPVLGEVRDVFNQKSDDLIRTFDAVYKIYRQAHFASVPPTWREYIMPAFSEQQCAGVPVRPANSEEEAIWKEGIIAGWKAGAAQGDKILEENLERLKRDFEGMVRYHKLLRLGMVSRPIAAKSTLGVTGDPSSVLNVNETIYRITIMPEFTMDKDKWK